MKVGDGIKTWSELDWFQAEENGVTQEALDALKKDLDELSTRVGLPADDDSEATGIYGEIAALAASMGLLIDEKIDAFANKITDDGKINTVIELVDYVDQHGKDTAELVTKVNTIQELVGDKPVAEQVQEAIVTSGALTAESLEGLYTPVKYEISSSPAGTLVNYDDIEIRVMCPADTEWTQQASGEGADKNSYYIGFKAYAPKNAVNFKEDLAETISDDTLYSFENNEFAGVDGYGRKYSIVWLPVASYDTEANTWKYFGASSSKAKYIGWYYSVEWYDVNGKVISSDVVRINLSNEACHNVTEPYYMANVVKEISVNGVLCDVVNNRVNLEITAGNVVSGDEISVNEDGTLSIQKVDASKIVTSEESPLILNGGSANV